MPYVMFYAGLLTSKERTYAWNCMVICMHLTTTRLAFSRAHSRWLSTFSTRKTIFRDANGRLLSFFIETIHENADVWEEAKCNFLPASVARFCSSPLFASPNWVFRINWTKRNVIATKILEQGHRQCVRKCKVAREYFCIGQFPTQTEFF